MSFRGLAFLLLNSLLSPGLLKSYKEFIKISGWTKEQLFSLQQKRLHALLDYAYYNIPFYGEFADKKQGLSLEDFPILTKQDIISNYQQLMSPRLKDAYLRGLKNSIFGWIEVKTGGSTGSPTTVIHNYKFRVNGRASRLFSQYLCGFPVGTPFIMLWGSMKDIDNSRNSILRKLFLHFQKIDILNAFQMDTGKMQNYFAFINNSRSENIMGYVDSLYNLSRYISSNNLFVKRINNIMACAGTVIDYEKKEISRVFKARVFNKYGSRDCTDMACECRMGGIHIFSNHVVIEIVDDKGNPCKSGNTGRILVTLLGNNDFPLIRYEIGDIGSFSEEDCKCGMPYPLFNKIEGRSYELISDVNGNFVTPVFLRHLIGVVNNPNLFNRFQFIQMTDKKYKLLLERLSSAPDSLYLQNVAKIRNSLQVVLGGNAEIDVTDVEKISESESGKFIYIKNEYIKTRSNK